jgi:hypothetical protein
VPKLNVNGKPDSMVIGPTFMGAIFMMSLQNIPDLCEHQGCHKGRFWRKITVPTSFSSGRPRGSAFTPRMRFYPRTGFYGPRTRKKNNNNNKKNLVVVAGLEREKFFSIFNFLFSIPKIPKIPKLPEFRGLRG